MTTPIVLQLQEMASESNTSVADLLRKARMVATKLKLDEINSWLSKELHGYNPVDEVPAYRKLSGDLRADNHMNGVAMPIRFDTEIMDVISAIDCRPPIGELQELLRRESDHYRFEFTDAVASDIRSRLPPLLKGWAMPYLRISPNQIFSVIDAVRAKILDWSLELEANGILGDGIRFSNNEVEKAAASVTHYTITNSTVQGIMGSVHHSQVEQNLHQTVKAGDLQSVRDALTKIGIPDADVRELESALSADPTPAPGRKALGPRVAEWIGSTSTKIASGAYELAVGAGGELIANVIWAFYGIH